MTNTAAATKPLPLKDQRTAWLNEMGALVGDGQLTSGEWLHVLERIRTEGPSLAIPSNERWAIRFRWITKQIERKHDLQWIVLQSLVDLHYANGPARLS